MSASCVSEGAIDKRRCRTLPRTTDTCPGRGPFALTGLRAALNVGLPHGAYDWPLSHYRQLGNLRQTVEVEHVSPP